MTPPKPRRILIGIDTGVNTGFAVYDLDRKLIERIETFAIHQAMFEVKKYFDDPSVKIVLVRVEDARKRTWYGNAGREKLQGAGSVKRDAKAWQDFLTDYQIPFEMVKPSAGATKWKEDAFKTAFGWSGRTTNHGRDAACLIVG